MSKRTTLIFSILVSYVVLQFLWWEVLLVKQAGDIISQKQKLAALSSTDDTIIKRDIADLQHKKEMRVYMITGEGTVFLLILLFGVYQVRKSVRKENEVNSQQKNFILSVSHELKTPIAATKLQLQTLLKHDLDREKQKQLLNNALTENERLLKLVDNVLLVNQIENKNLTISTQTENISDLVETVTQRYFTNYIETKQLQLNIEKNITYAVDKDLLPSIIINLVENAIKYSFGNIDVHVTLKSINNKPVLEISDKGCGIKEVEKEKIFEKFFRSGNEDTRKTKGTGIGLYIVKLICDLHQAKINVSDNTPNGSIFKIQF